jgi:Mlc titration factor MtfA (ptsG expression regulator)
MRCRSAALQPSASAAHPGYSVPPPSGGGPWGNHDAPHRPLPAPDRRQFAGFRPRRPSVGRYRRLPRQRDHRSRPGAIPGIGGETPHSGRAQGAPGRDLAQWRWRRRRWRGHTARAALAQLPARHVPLSGLFGRLLDPFRRTPPAIPDSAWQAARARAAWVAALEPEREAQLRELAALFLQRKAITPLAGLELDEHQRLLLAALCCLPLLEFGSEGLHGWSQLLVYPDAFRTHRSHVDAAGVLHEGEEELIGEAWEQGPLVLSWADVEADLDAPGEGFCVAVHEMAHKLDALDGAMDGTPPLPREWQRQWARDFQQAYDGFCRRVDAGRRIAIDDYAAESPEEFFAVCSEYHFSDPRTLRKAMPEVAGHLERFYGASPFL